MKKILAFLVLFSVITTSITAQRISLINFNNTEDIGKTKVTADATPVYIDSFSISNNEAGVFETSVIGYAKDTAYAVTGIKKVRYNKRRGTLTLGSVIDEQAVVADTPVSGATFTFVAAREKIFVQITGKAATTMNWLSITRRKGIAYR